MILAVAVSILVLSLTGCGSARSKIEDTVNEFEYACQNMDIDAILDTIDPYVSDSIRLVVAIYSGATGQDYEDFMDGVFDDLMYTLFGSNFDPYEFLSTISISEVKVKTQKREAIVTCELCFEIAGERFDRDATIYMVEEDENWYISYIDMITPVDD